MKAVIIGGSGHFEYAVLSQCNECDIVAFAPASVDEVLQRLILCAGGKYKQYDDYIQMLDEEQPDVAIINPHFYLIPTVLIECLKRKIHCFVEKPLAFTLSELEEIESLAANAHIGMMMIHRYQAAFYGAYTAVRNGEIGAIRLISVRKSYKMDVKPSWMHVKQKFGGIIPWVGAHALDIVQWMDFGQAINISAYSIHGGNKGMGEIESVASVHMVSENDCIANVTLDYLRPESLISHGDDSLMIAGDRGIIEVRNNTVSLVADNSDQEKELPLQKQPKIFQDFIRSVRGEATYRISFNDACETARMYIAAEESALHNQKVRIK